MKNKLAVILGPTATGKTATAVALANRFGSGIISADSRQFYKELKIGVAAPSEQQMKAVPHHFIGHLSVTDYYNVSMFEQDVLGFLRTYFEENRLALMVGGSGLYIHAVCHGIDDLPDADGTFRQQLKMQYEKKGIDYLRSELKKLDPGYYQKVDLNNPNRLLRAIEVCMITGKTYTELRQNLPVKRDFDILKIGLNLPRNDLFRIISERVDEMMESGLLSEVESLLPYRHQNALNTVGYKELFDFLDGKLPLEEAVEKIKTNTRRYAKRQLTWFRKDPAVRWFHPGDQSGIFNAVHDFRAD